MILKYLKKFLLFYFLSFEKTLTYLGYGNEIKSCKDVSEYLKLDIHKVIKRARVKDTKQEDKLWNNLKPIDKEGYRLYYNKNIHYLERQDWYNRHYKLSSLMKIPKNGNFLDYGCGTAFVAVKLVKKRNDINIYLADIKESLTKDFAKWRFKKNNIKINWFDIPNNEVINYKTKFDYIRCCDVLEHTFHPNIVVKGFYDSLVDGGILEFDFLFDPDAKKENTSEAQILRDETLNFIDENFIKIEQNGNRHLVRKY